MNAVSHTDSDRKVVKCKMIVNTMPVNLQIDTESRINVLPVRFAKKENVLLTITVLKTWNDEHVNFIGVTRTIVRNLEDDKKWLEEFIVCRDG